VSLEREREVKDYTKIFNSIIWFDMRASYLKGEIDMNFASE